MSYLSFLYTTARIHTKLSSTESGSPLSTRPSSRLQRGKWQAKLSTALKASKADWVLGYRHSGSTQRYVVGSTVLRLNREVDNGFFSVYDIDMNKRKGKGKLKKEGVAELAQCLLTVNSFSPFFGSLGNRESEMLTNNARIFSKYY